MKTLLFIAGVGFVAYGTYQRNPSLKWRLKAAKHSLLGWPVIANCKLDGTIHLGVDNDNAFIYNTRLYEYKFSRELLDYRSIACYTASMIWQDYVVSISSVFMIFGLLPSVRGVNKPAFKTSVITGFWLYVIVGVYLTLGLWLSAALLAVHGILWSMLAIQAYKSKGTFYASNEEFLDSLRSRIK